LVQSITSSQPIIDEPRLYSPQRKAVDHFISVAGATIVAYFFFLLTLAAWYFAGLYFIDQIFSWRHIEETVSIFLWLIITALFAYLCMWAWAEYNYRSFAHLTRRTFPPPTTVEEVAELYGTTPDYVLFARRSKVTNLQSADRESLMCDADGFVFRVRKVQSLKGTY